MTVRRTLAFMTAALVLVGGRAAGSPASTAPTAQDSAVDRTLGFTAFVTEGGRERRDVAITFDDGPSEWTPRIARELRRLHAPATFFEIGNQVPDLAATTRRLARLGFVIGDHSETHPPMAHHGHGFQRYQVRRSAAFIARTGAPYPRLFRPPYGSFNATTFRVLREFRMLMVLWTNDTEDYAMPGVRQIVGAALADLRPGAIVLMHDGGGDRSQTLAALPRIVRALRARGYRLVTVPQMLAEDPPSPHQPIPGGTGPSATTS